MKWIWTEVLFCLCAVFYGPPGRRGRGLWQRGGSPTAGSRWSRPGSPEPAPPPGSGASPPPETDPAPTAPTPRSPAHTLSPLMFYILFYFLSVIFFVYFLWTSTSLVHHRLIWIITLGGICFLYYREWSCSATSLLFGHISFFRLRNLLSCKPES